MIRAIIQITEDVLIGSIVEKDDGFRVCGVYSMEKQPGDRYREVQPLYLSFEQACQEVYRVVKDAQIIECK